MFKIQIVALGEWTSNVEIESPFTLKHEAIDHEWKEELIQLGWDQGVLSKAELKKIRQQTHVIWAEYNVEMSNHCTMNDSDHSHDVQSVTPRAHIDFAQESADLLKQLADHATVLYFDPSMKVLTPSMAKELIADDPVTLLHMLIDFWGDEGGMYASGMQVFALPDLKVTGTQPKSATLQATVFSAAAQMICEKLQLTVGESFRASESFPWFEITDWVLQDHSDEAETENPYGVLHLHLKSS